MVWAMVRVRVHVAQSRGPLLQFVSMFQLVALVALKRFMCSLCLSAFWCE